MLSRFRGGRNCLPLSVKAGKEKALQALVGLLALGLLLPPASIGYCQRRPLGGPGQNRPARNPNIQRPNAPAGDSETEKAVMELLRKMIRPTVEYAGTQQTDVFGPNEQSSQQDIRGDARGHVRIDFRSPPRVAGDVMLISPGEFHNFHHLRNVDEMASWPTEWNEQEKRMFGMIRQGAVSARRTGEEQIAGRTAVIIELSLKRPGGQGNGLVQRKYWVDSETGIQLRIEKYTRGVLSSRTNMLSLTIGAAARVSPQDFLANFPGAKTALFPAGAAPFRTVADTQGRLPFHPLEPANLPAGFHLDGVWIFDGEGKGLKQGNILMRYTDGVASFSLYQRFAPQKEPTTPAPRSFGRNLQHWLKGSPEGTVQVQYIGHLSADQAQSLYTSLR